MPLEYPVTITPDDNFTFLVTFPDLPAVSYGDTIEEALHHAAEALGTILEAYLNDRRPIPPPSTGRSTYRVAVPAPVEAKLPRGR